MQLAIAKRLPNTMKFVLLSFSLVLAGVIAGSALANRNWLSFQNNVGLPAILSGAPAATPTVDRATLAAGFSSTAKAVMPAVVTIETQGRARMPQMQQFPFQLTPEQFQEFFREYRQDEDSQPNQRRRPRLTPSPQPRGRLMPMGAGSGVIVSADGYILTNNHVVEGADKVEVELNDRRRFTAKVIGTDEPSDLAVLKIEGSGLPTIPFGDSDKVEIGDLALAVGNPLNIGQTVTMGIISAKGRSTRTAGSGNYEDFIQTDAAINRGNSGGALVNLSGELIGIPTQIVSPTGGSIGIGFAIPTNMARKVMDQLLKTGKVQRGRLGISIGEVNTELGEQFGYKGTKGAFVQDVEAGLAAERAGVKPGDIITEFQGQRIEDSSQLRNLVGQTGPGATVKFKVWRDGAERELSATLSELKAATTDNKRDGSDDPASASNALMGLQVEALTPEAVRQLNLPASTRGVIVRDVDPESAAALAGIREGDVIEEVNRQAVSNSADFKAAMQKAGKKNVLLRVRNQNGARFVVLKADE